MPNSLLDLVDWTTGSRPSALKIPALRKSRSASRRAGRDNGAMSKNSGAANEPGAIPRKAAAGADLTLPADARKAGTFNWTVTTRNPLHKICRALTEMSSVEYSQAVAQGVPAALLIPLAESTGSSLRGLVTMLGMSRTTVYRQIDKGENTPLAHFEGDAAADFARLLGEAQVLAGQGKQALAAAGQTLGHWLLSPNDGLGGQPPATVMSVGMGRAHVYLLRKRLSAQAPD